MTHERCTIEDRLTAEARAIVAAQPTACATARILAEHGRRDRHRRTRRKVAAAALAGALVAAILGVPLPQNEDTSSRNVPGDPRAAASSDPLTGETDAPLMTLSEAALREAGGSGAVAIPLLVTVGEWNGRTLVAPAVYVPSHVRQIDHMSLSPTERSAVERLLEVTSTTRGDDRDVTL